MVFFFSPSFNVTWWCTYYEYCFSHNGPNEPLDYNFLNLRYNVINLFTGFANVLCGIFMCCFTRFLICSEKHKYCLASLIIKNTFQLISSSSSKPSASQETIFGGKWSYKIYYKFPSMRGAGLHIMVGIHCTIYYDATYGLLQSSAAVKPCCTCNIWGLLNAV